MNARVGLRSLGGSTSSGRSHSRRVARIHSRRRGSQRSTVSRRHALHSTAQTDLRMATGTANFMPSRPNWARWRNLLLKPYVKGFCGDSFGSRCRRIGSARHTFGGNAGRGYSRPRAARWNTPRQPPRRGSGAAAGQNAPNNIRAPFTTHVTRCGEDEELLCEAVIEWCCTQCAA